MIGLDTNVIIRYLVQDDLKQAKIVNRAIEKWIKNGETLWICLVTLCEVYWVLERCYKLDKDELISVITSLLHTTQIMIQRDDIVRQALRDFKNSKNVEFTDCLISTQNLINECKYTCTFDKIAAKELNTSFKLIDSLTH